MDLSLCSDEATKCQCDPWAYEKQVWANGYTCVAGVDEAGRGPLAGPVVAAAVVLPKDFDTVGIGDSKAMSAKAREAMFERITSKARFGVGIASPKLIDEINILRATYHAMRAALDAIDAAFDFILVDGLPVPDLPRRSIAIVKGDSLSVSIGAASIVAKVSRDRIMVDMDCKYPEYGFASHKGYGSRLHLEALDRYGPCPCHRKSFAPVAKRVNLCRLPGLE